MAWEASLMPSLDNSTRNWAQGGQSSRFNSSILSWSWGMSNSGSAHQGSGAGSGKVNVQDVSITKYIE